MKALKSVRKSLCLLLAMALLCAAPATGARAASCNCREIPRIGLPGIGDALCVNPGTPEQADVSVVDMEGLQDQIVPILGDLTSAVARRSWDKAADAFIALAWGMFGHLQVVDCESVEPIFAKPSDDPYKKDHRESHDFGFKYDWRMDPWEIAAQLNAYIKEVKKATGHSKVALLPHSEGGLVCMAYFARYGYDDIRDFIPQMSAHNGLTMVGELFNKNVELGADVALQFMRGVGESKGGEGAMALMVPGANLLQTTGLAAWLIGLLGLVLEHVQEKVFEEALVPLFVQWPALWGFVPHEYYESAKKELLAGKEFDVLRRAVDNMHYKAGAGYKADELIKKAVKAGVRVCIISGYGFTSMPFTPGLDIDADGLIDTARESSGATTAGLWNHSFPEGYKQKINDGHNHISPDGKIDASTCLLPEQTWFLRGQIHFSGSFGKLKDEMIYSAKQFTVHSSKDFPQFFTYVSDGVFVPNTPVPAAPRSTLAGSAWLFNEALGKVAWESVKGVFTG